MANFGLISQDHPNAIVRLITSGGPVSFGPQFLNGDDEYYQASAGNTATAGTVWTRYAPISAGDYATQYIYCYGANTALSYTVELYDAPTSPAVYSGAVSLDSASSSPNEIDFVAPATAHYVADLTLTQGSVDLCCDAGGNDQVFASSGRFDLGYLGPGSQPIQLTPMDGPEAKWSLSIHALPVVMSGLGFDVPYIRPTQITTLSYSVDGDVTLNAALQNQSGQVVRTLASDLAVVAGNHTLEWDGLDGSGAPVPDGTYTLKMSYTDAAGNAATDTASIEVDTTPPVVTVASPSTLNPSNGLVINLHDTLSGLTSASLSVDGRHVQSLPIGGNQFIYVPSGGWAPGPHTWNVTATDNAGNTGTASGSFSTPGCLVPRVVGQTLPQARAAMLHQLCSLGKVYRVSSRNHLKGHVIAQYPHAGLLLPEHAQVYLEIGRGRRR